MSSFAVLVCVYVGVFVYGYLDKKSSLYCFLLFRNFKR